MQVLVGLICLVPALGLQQAVSYQNFRTSHGQGHPTYRSDGSWSQSFGGGLGKDLSVIRVNNQFLGSGHQNFGPSQSSFGQNSYNPGPSTTGVGLQSTAQYTDPGPSFSPTTAPSQASSFESQPNYNSPSPLGNNLINNGAGLAYSDSPLPSFTPESLPPPQNFGNDRLPPYASDSAPQNYNSNGPIHNSNPEPTQYSGGPQYLENRGGSPEFRSEASLPASFQQNGPTPLGPLSSSNPDGRSLSYQESPSYTVDASYQAYEGPKRDFTPIQNQGPGPNQFISNDYNGLSHNTNGGSPNSNYVHIGRAPTSNNAPPGKSYSGEFEPNGRPLNSDYRPNGRGPNSNFRPSSGSPSSNYSPGGAVSSSYSSNERGPTSDFGSSGRGPNSDFGPNGRVPNSNFGRNGRGPNSNFRPNHGGPVSDFRPNNERPNINFGPNGRGPHSDFSSHYGSPNTESGPNDRGTKQNYESNGKGRISNFGSSGRGPNSQVRGPSSDFKQQGRLPFSDSRSNERGIDSGFSSNGKGPSSDFKSGETELTSDFSSNIRGSSFANKPSRPNFSDRNPSLESGGSRKHFGRPHHSPLENTGPQIFSQHKSSFGPKKPLGPNNSQGLKSFDDKKPLRGTPAKFEINKSKDRSKPNFSAEDGEQSFESDFKSSELGAQSFEADIPDFSSDESYFNSQEAYGSFDSGGKGNFGSAEEKDSLEINNSPKYESGKKGFSDRDASVDSQERSQSAESNGSDGPEEGSRERFRSGLSFRNAPPPGRTRIAEEKKLDLSEKKLLSPSGDKKGFIKSEDSEEKPFSESRSGPSPRPTDKKTSNPIQEPTPLPYKTDLTMRKPFTSPPSKLFPEKKASFAIEKFVPFDKPFALLAPSKRTPYAVESRIPYEVKVPFDKAFREELRRLYKRQPFEEKNESKRSIAEMNVPTNSKNLD